VLYHRGADISGKVETCSITSGGLARSYLRYVPESVDPGVPAALLVSLHAGFQDPQTQMRWFPFDELADEKGFIVVAPSADGLWNLGVTNEQYCAFAQMSYDCGMIDPFTEELVEPPPPDCQPDESGPPAETVPDDLTFLEDVIAAVADDHAIDDARVYLVGASWGGWMASRAACALSDRFAAVAGLTNTIWYVPECEADRPVPFIGIGGGNDIYHPTCMAEAYAVGWAEHNHCDPSAAREVVDGDVTRLSYSGCSDDASVIVYTMEDLWLYPQMEVPAGFEPLRTIWAFFENHDGP
jgi:poly(3-hydroxybutyrate) depolymerase